MDKIHYDEMLINFREQKEDIKERDVYLFGHCEASLSLADLLIENDIHPIAILDNSEAKHGKDYKKIPVIPPRAILTCAHESAVVLIVTRFYEAMNTQLRKLGFQGRVIKLVDYNTYAEYSLSEDTRNRKRRRAAHGEEILLCLKEKHPSQMMIFCPFHALGDIYFAMSYLPAFMKRKGVDNFVVCVPSDICACVVRLFGYDTVEILEQKELDAAVQAVIYTGDEKCFIAHQDRPYVVNLHKALRRKKIPLEKVYCCGIFGLSENTEPVQPAAWKEWGRLNEIAENKAVILAPYAKSVPALPKQLWVDIVSDYKECGYQVFTNVGGSEEALPGTEPLRARLCEMKSILERAGTFIGIRSGLCDVVRTADCKKTALYPDYYYCDTRWKSIDMYAIDGFDNIEVKDGVTWKRIKEQIGK